MSNRGLPALQGEGGLSRYLSEIRKFPLLEPEEEYMFAKRWREHEDPEAARNRPRPLLRTTLVATCLRPSGRIRNLFRHPTPSPRPSGQ